MTGKSNKIAKNSFCLGLRTAVTILIALYSSLLKNIGFEDLGIYNTIGSVILFEGVLRGFFSSAVQRFLCG